MRVSSYSYFMHNAIFFFTLFRLLYIVVYRQRHRMRLSLQFFLFLNNRPFNISFFVFWNENIWKELMLVLSLFRWCGEVMKTAVIAKAQIKQSLHIVCIGCCAKRVFNFVTIIIIYVFLINERENKPLLSYLMRAQKC